MQQKYWDHGRSSVLLTTTCPIFLRPQLLRHRREANQRINLTVGEELNRVGDRVHDPVDVFLGIEPHVGGHGGEEDVVRGAECWNAHPHPLQVADRTNPLGPEKLEAANVDSRQEDNRQPCIHMDEERCDERHADVNPSRREQQTWVYGLVGDVLHIDEAFGLQQFLGNVLRRDADPWDPVQPDPRRLRRRLRGERLRFQSKESCGSRQGHPQELSPAPAFSLSLIHGTPQSGQNSLSITCSTVNGQ